MLTIKLQLNLYKSLSLVKDLHSGTPAIFILKNKIYMTKLGGLHLTYSNDRLPLVGRTTSAFWTRRMQVYHVKYWGGAPNQW